MILVKEFAKSVDRDHTTVIKKLKREMPESLHRVRGKSGQLTWAIDEGCLQAAEGIWQPFDNIEAMQPHEIVRKTSVFYMAVLDPIARPHRVKFGFSGGQYDRWDTHKTTCPEIQLMSTWPCIREWESMAIKSITRTGAALVAGEVYDVEDVERTEQLADEFFFETIEKLGHDPSTSLEQYPDNKESWLLRRDEYSNRQKSTSPKSPST